MKFIIYVLTYLSLTNLALGITFEFGDKDAVGNVLGKAEITQELEGTISFNICKNKENCSYKRMNIDGMKDRMNHFHNVLIRVYDPSIVNEDGDLEYINNLFIDTMKQFKIVATNEVYSLYQANWELLFTVLQDQSKLETEANRGTFQPFLSGILNSGIDSDLLVSLATDYSGQKTDYPLNESMAFGFILFSNAID